MDHVHLVEGTRTSPHGEHFVETVHHGSICVVDGNGQVLRQVGDIDTTTPLRSTVKAFQLLPLLMAGLHVDEPGRPSALNLRDDDGLADLAVMMSSHSGESRHTERISSLLSRNGLQASLLQCGTHPPIDQGRRTQLIQQREAPDVLHCNCSGKHTGMLIVCQANGWDLEHYLDPDHPLQKQIRGVIESLGESTAALPHVTDGCSLPTFVVSLRLLARLFACLANPTQAARIAGRNVTRELALLFRAATRHPDMIAGTGRLDTELMRACAGQVFAKSGADGVYALAVRANKQFPSGMAAAIKIAHDDSNSRIRRTVALALLAQCNIEFDSSVLPAHDEIRNNRGSTVGKLRPCFTLRV